MFIEDMMGILPKKGHGRGRRQAKHNITNIIEDFLDSGVEVGKVHYTAKDYGSMNSAYKSIYASIQNGHYPVRITVRNGELYLVRRS